MNIVLVEPSPSFNLYFFIAKMPLLGPLYLGTILEKAGHSVKVFKEGYTRMYNEKTDALHPAIKDADVVGISSITHSSKRAYAIADAVKRQYPGIRVVMGGSHPSALPDEALLHADCVVVGEAENVVRKVFETDVRGIVQGEKTDMDTLPPIDLSLLQDVKRNYRNRLRDIAPIMASRGCPHDCVFCSVTGMFGRKYRIRNADLVMEEVRMRYGEGYRFSFFYDDNFAASPAKTKIFLEKLIKADLDFEWSSQFSVHAAKDRELLDLMKRAKCRRMYIGIESINPEALKDYNKSQTVEEIRSAIGNIHDAGLQVHTMLILGADSDTKESVKRTVRFARESKSDSAQFSILYPIPGTRLYTAMKEQNRLFVDDWEYYDGSHSVIIPKNFTPLKLQKFSIRAYRSFYSRTIVHWMASRMGFLIWKLMNLEYLKHLRRVSRKISRKAFDKMISEKYIEGLRRFGELHWLKRIGYALRREGAKYRLERLPEQIQETR